MKNQKLSDLLFDKPAKGLKIKDYALIQKIFISYLNEHYEWMSREIFFYNDFDFANDLAIYLSEHFKTDNFRRFFFTDIMEEYHERLPKLLYERSIRKLKKQYGL